MKNFILALLLGSISFTLLGQPLGTKGSIPLRDGAMSVDTVPVDASFFDDTRDYPATDVVKDSTDSDSTGIPILDSLYLPDLSAPYMESLRLCTCTKELCLKDHPADGDKDSVGEDLGYEEEPIGEYPWQVDYLLINNEMVAVPKGYKGIFIRNGKQVYTHYYE